jgi:hypothetical protein
MPVRLLGTISPAGGGPPACVQISDLSRGGACCRVTRPLPSGTEVELALDGLRARAVVCWGSGAQIGLRFVEKLRASDILIQSSRSRCGAEPERPVHLAYGSRMLRYGG